MKLVMPDCKGDYDAFSLTPQERRELVRRIAEKGAGAIDEYIKEREAEGDSTIAARVRKLREELMRRAEELKRRLAEEFGGREAEAEAQYRARLAQLASSRESLEHDFERLQLDADIGAALRANPIIALALDAPAQAAVPWWRKMMRFLARVLRILLFPILWLLRLVAPRKKSPTRVALAGVPGTAIDAAGDLYLSDPTFRRAVRSKLTTRDAWDRLLGREDYESLAKKAMAQIMAEEAERAAAQRQDAGRALQDQIAAALERERNAALDRDATLAQLEAEREAEARRIEEALRDAPETEVKEAIVDDLKAAGLLRESAGGLLPTLQFMDRFAALVYHDEMRGATGGARGATGDYAEGEGHYMREPLRSALETSRMDIAASLLRARSRHPKVRHLVDDDVVIYREEREGALHVVLIVDRSGSMENGRIDAAKRAALALHHAVKRQNPRSKVDILLMDTSVRAVTLREVWDTQPRGFTNTGAALRLAREACQRNRGGRTLVYLVTDGLPEAYTKGGEDVAGHPEKAMAYAKEQARLLARERGLAGFVMLLVEPEDERYVTAAEGLAKEANGRVLPVDPKELARTLLRQVTAPAPAA